MADRPSIRVEGRDIVSRMPITQSNVRHVDQWVGSYTHDDAFMDLLKRYVGARALRTTVDAPR